MLAPGATIFDQDRMLLSADTTKAVVRYRRAFSKTAFPLIKSALDRADCASGDFRNR
jgi:hypothetical protein